MTLQFYDWRAPLSVIFSYASSFYSPEKNLLKEIPTNADTGGKIELTAQLARAIVNEVFSQKPSDATRARISQAMGDKHRNPLEVNLIDHLMAELLAIAEGWQGKVNRAALLAILEATIKPSIKADESMKLKTTEANPLIIQ